MFRLPGDGHPPARLSQQNGTAILLTTVGSTLLHVQVGVALINTIGALGGFVGP